MRLVQFLEVFLRDPILLRARADAHAVHARARLRLQVDEPVGDQLLRALFKHELEPVGVDGHLELRQGPVLLESLNEHHPVREDGSLQEAVLVAEVEVLAAVALL